MSKEDITLVLVNLLYILSWNKYYNMTIFFTYSLDAIIFVWWVGSLDFTIVFEALGPLALSSDYHDRRNISNLSYDEQFSQHNYSFNWSVINDILKKWKPPSFIPIVVLPPSLHQECGSRKHSDQVCQNASIYIGQIRNKYGNPPPLREVDQTLKSADTNKTKTVMLLPSNQGYHSLPRDREYYSFQHLGKVYEIFTVGWN